MNQQYEISLPRACAPWLAAIIWLVPLESFAAPESSVEVLVVPPGGWVRLVTPEDGATLEAALDGGLLRQVDGGLQAPQTGDHWLATAARNRSGSLSTLRWVLLKVDSEAPEVELSFAPEPVTDETGDLWLPPGAHARARADDQVSGLEILTLDSGQKAISGSDSLELELPASGTSMVTVGAEDRVGNRSAERQQEVRIDANSPTGEIRAEGPQAESGGRLVLGPGAKLVARIEDEESGLANWSRRLDDVETSLEGWAGPWPAGEHRALAVTRDRVGNEGTVGPLTFLSDPEGPNLHWRVVSEGVRGDDGNWFYRPPVTVEISSSDEPAGAARLAWSRGEDSWVDIPTDGGRVETPADTLMLRSEDRVGNESRAEASWRVDGEPPRLFLRLPDGTEPAPETVVTVAEGSRLEALVEDAGVGVAKQRAFLEPGIWSLSLPEITLSTRGTYRLELRGEDLLGNRSRSHWWLRVIGAEQ